MKLDWIYLRHGNLTTRDTQYTVTDKTIWEHSRVTQERYEARHNNTSLGYYPTKAAALDACERHAQDPAS